MKALFLLICTLILNGCSSSGERFKNFEDVADNKSSLYVYSTSKEVPIWLTIFIDGQEQFSLNKAGFIFTELDPGQHEIKVGVKSFNDSWIRGEIIRSLDFEEGKTNVLRFELTRSISHSALNKELLFSASAALISVNEEQAILDLKKLNSNM